MVIQTIRVALTCLWQLMHSRYRVPSFFVLVGVLEPVPFGSPFEEGVPDLDGAAREAMLVKDGGT